MQPTDDSPLLRQYAENHSDEAFSALVQRHVGLVYSVALRQVGHPDQAEEIAQAVFIILARKAGSLRHDKALPGWLFQTTRLTANNFIRSSLRRHRNEQEAYMQSLLNEPDDCAWEQIRPLLDSAVAALPGQDRRAILLRFYEGQTLREVGQALGASMDAAEKRVARALEKLRKFFSQHGVESTTRAIAGTLSVHSIQPAPVGLAKTISAVALAKSATASASTLTLVKGALKIMAWTNTKTAVAVAAALIIAGGAGVVVVHEIHSPRPVPLPSDGIPVTLEQLNVWYAEPPAGQNAATFDLQGIKAMQTKGADQIADLPILGKLPPPDPAAPLLPNVKSALASFLNNNRTAIDLFAQGAKFEKSRYPVDFTQGQNLRLPHLPGIKRAELLSEMAAIFDADNNDGKQAANDVLITLALARSLNAEPDLISQLVRVAGISLAVDGLNQLVNRTTLPRESLTQLSQAFQAMDDSDEAGDGFNRSIIGEKVMVVSAVDELSADSLAAGAADGTTDEQRQRMLQRLKQPGGIRDEKQYLETTFRQLIAGHQEDLPARLKNASALQPAEDEADNGLLLLNNSWLTGYTNIVRREARSVANLRLALTALALEQYRAVNNQYPDTLSQLVPAYLESVPLDPFDSQPLRYRKQTNGYLLYSIGLDLKDEGGRRRTGQRGNIVFAVGTQSSL